MTMTTGGIGPLLTGGRKMGKTQKTLPPTAKTKRNPPGGNASYERNQKSGKKPKARGRRTIGDRYGLTI